MLKIERTLLQLTLGNSVESNNESSERLQFCLLSRIGSRPSSVLAARQFETTWADIPHLLVCYRPASHNFSSCQPQYKPNSRGLQNLMEYALEFIRDLAKTRLVKRISPLGAICWDFILVHLSVKLVWCLNSLEVD
jgi:hypothetical protein